MLNQCSIDKLYLQVTYEGKPERISAIGITVSRDAEVPPSGKTSNANPPSRTADTPMTPTRRQKY